MTHGSGEEPLAACWHGQAHDASHADELRYDRGPSASGIRRHGNSTGYETRKESIALAGKGANADPVCDPDCVGPRLAGVSAPVDPIAGAENQVAPIRHERLHDDAILAGQALTEDRPTQAIISRDRGRNSRETREVGVMSVPGPAD